MTKPGTDGNPLRVAIVGSGPTGFYVAAPLLKEKELAVRVDMFDRLPTPFGLVRGGVGLDGLDAQPVVAVKQDADVFRPIGVPTSGPAAAPRKRPTQLSRGGTSSCRLLKETKCTTRGGSGRGGK